MCFVRRPGGLATSVDLTTHLAHTPLEMGASEGAIPGNLNWDLDRDRHAG